MYKAQYSYNKIVQGTKMRANEEKTGLIAVKHANLSKILRHGLILKKRRYLFADTGDNLREIFGSKVR